MSSKHWAYVKALISSCGYLSESLRTLGNTYRRTLIGLATDSSIEKQAFHNADDAFSEPVGLYYGKTYFGEEAKKDVVDMVKSIIEMYKKRMAKNHFLAKATKEKAILKLSTMVIKMGYPDKIQPLYDTLTVEEGTSFFAAMVGVATKMCSLKPSSRCSIHAGLSDVMNRFGTLVRQKMIERFCR